MPPHAHLHITGTSRIAVARRTTGHRAAANAAKYGPDTIGTSVIIQPTAVVHVSPRTDAPPPAPGKLSPMAPVANA